ncbi:hypothetical protein [Vallitalea sp.]|jgi:predicted negative regulator of RcsB-dependent stress response|uniref:hypothetical protein n=1 Tax=Vallitalea sp. TaxID=1882829 RepID=UPI0025FB647B|nr:hypothetical protein [Vallitalea sp.]MCT4687021.1 hypothetical protein [Vallitalea sp.]
MFQNKNELHNSNMAGRDVNIYYEENNRIESILLDEIPRVREDYVQRKDIEKDYMELLENENIIQLYGISGIGKTELTKRIVNDVAYMFEKTYWISCNKNSVINLKSIRGISGEKIDLISKVKEMKCLIILDNAFNGVNELIKIFSRNNMFESKVIIISQQKLGSRTTKKLPLEFMKKEEAEQIFYESIFQKCGFKDLLSQLEYHPLMLMILKMFLLDEDNGLNVEDFKDIKKLVKLKDDELTQSERICNKIIGDYYSKNNNICILISNLGKNELEESFLKKCILDEIPCLIKKCFLKYEEGYYYLHDIILNSIKAIISSNSNKEGLVFVPEIKEFLITENEKRSLQFYSFFAFHEDFLYRMLKASTDNEFNILIYNSILLFSNHQNIDKHINNIEKLLIKDKLENYYSIKLYIEKLELIVQDKRSKQGRNEKVSDAIKELKNLQKKELDDESQLLVKHHIAKFYNWNNDYNEAIELLKEILEKKPNESSTLLQLLRVYRQWLTKKNVSREEKAKLDNAVKNILENADYQKMPVAIYLEMVNLVKNRPLNTVGNLNSCLWSNFDYFKKIVMLYSKNGVFEHIYYIMGELAETISYKEGKFFDEWFRTIEHPVELKKKDMLSSIIKIYISEIKLRKNNGDDYKLLLKYLEECWFLYKEKYFKKKKNPFEYNLLVKMYISIEEYNRALEELDEVYDKENIWNLKNMALIKSGLGELDVALNIISNAINKYRESKDPFYLFAFLKDKADILYKKADKECIDNFIQAIESCHDDKLQLEWREILKEWKKEYNMIQQ